MANQNQSRSQPVLPAKRKYASRQSLPFQAWMIQKKRKQRNEVVEVIDPLQALIASLYGSNEQGGLYVPKPVVDGTQALFQDAAGTTAVTADGEPVGLMLDQSPNSVDASQSTAAAKPAYKVTPDRLLLDIVDDSLTITVPTGGWTGTMVLATDQGTASYGVSIPAGAYGLGGKYFPGTAIVGALFRDGAMTAGEKAEAESYFVDNGATASYGAVSGFSRFWQGRTEITEFPVIDVTGSNTLSNAFLGCSSITSFPVIDTSGIATFSYTWFDCSSITSFPLLDYSSGSLFSNTWRNCTSLTSFPANSFDNISGGNFSSAFQNTALDETSIDGILVSLVTSGLSAGFLNFKQSGGSAPSVGTGQPAIDTLRGRGWTVVVTGLY